MKRQGTGGAVHRLLLRLPAETAHGLGMTALRLGGLPLLNKFLSREYRFSDPRLAQRLLGTTYPNPVGLAAGFDKNGLAIASFAKLGFGSIEVGTVTPRGQEGNPRPRLFRHPEAGTLENAMGFNNRGAEALARRLERRVPFPVPVGVNVGKNKATPAERVVEEYAGLVRRFDGLCDYFVVNVSSPNTPGLRDLQTAAVLRRILAAALAATERPVLVKLSPDLETGQAVELAGESVAAGAAGIILTNTTTDYELLPGARRIGGLSGRVLRERSFELLVATARSLGGRGLLVSVGGIDSGEEAYRRIKAGAHLIQLYTALALGGPAVPGRIAAGLTECLERDGFGSLSEAVGTDL